MQSLHAIFARRGFKTYYQVMHYTQQKIFAQQRLDRCKYKVWSEEKIGLTLSEKNGPTFSLKKSSLEQWPLAQSI